MIAKSTAARLERIRAQGVEPGKRILVIGYGTVGRATTRALRKLGYDVVVYDKDPATRAKAARELGEDAVYATLFESLRESKIVLGITGNSALDAEALDQLPSGAILINGASSANEFVPNVLHLVSRDSRSWPRYEANAMVGTFQGKKVVLGEAPEPGEMSHGQDWILRSRPGRELLLVNQGQVVNFDNSAHSDPPRYMQLTRWLLYQAVLQGAGATGNGIQRLKLKPQLDFVAEMKAELAETGETFDQLNL
jgi:hypothetical protein